MNHMGASVGSSNGWRKPDLSHSDGLTGSTSGMKVPPVRRPMTAVASAVTSISLMPMTLPNVVPNSRTAARTGRPAPAVAAACPSARRADLDPLHRASWPRPRGSTYCRSRPRSRRCESLRPFASASACIAAATSPSSLTVPPRPLREDGRAGVGHGVGGVLRHALVGVGVAALEHERHAADDRHHRQRGDDDDLPGLAAGCGATGGSWPWGNLGVRLAPARAHGCLGHVSAVGKSALGQRYSTLSTDRAVKVTPSAKMTFAMIGVIGR